MKKVLFTATVDSHILHFHIPYLKYFHDNGYEVHVATNGDEEIPYCDKKIKISFERSPFKLNNLRAIRQLKKVLEEEKYDIIHTHTPMGGVVTRLAAKKTRKVNNTRLIYTAHGFHFYKGAPLKNWLIYYPVEKYLSKYTDTLITINTEDYELARKKFRCDDIEYVHGVGLDEKKFDFKMTKDEKHSLRKSLGLKDDDFVMIYPAELNKNKNQFLLINVMERLVREYDNIHLILPGKDSYNGYYQRLTKEKKLEHNIHFLGYRNDIPKLLKISDVAVASSKREGLGLNLIEALYMKLPVVAVNNRGHRDIIKDGNNGYLIKNDDIDGFRNAILTLYNGFKIDNIDIDNFLLSNVLEEMQLIYKLNLYKYKQRNDLISIIIPVYNVEKYIKKCIESIINQTYKNIEIILVNDGSTDNSLKMCEAYLYDKRVKIFTKKNGGLSSARNYGVTKSHGKYIMFVDSDDWLDYDCVENLVNELNFFSYDLILFPYIREYRKNSYKREILPKNLALFTKVDIENKLLKKLIGPAKNDLKKPLELECLNTAWGKLYKTSIIKNINFIDLNNIATEDLPYNVNVFCKINSAKYVDTTYYHYNKMNDKSITKTEKFNLLQRWKNLFLNIENTLYNNNLFSDNMEISLNNRKILNLFSICLKISTMNCSLHEKNIILKNTLSDEVFKDAFDKFSYNGLNIFWIFFYKLCELKLTYLLLFVLFCVNNVKIRK